MDKALIKNKIWYAKDIVEEASWKRGLHSEEISIIDDFFKNTKDLSITFDKSQAKNPILKMLSPLFEEIMNALQNNYGFFVLRNCPVPGDKISIEQVRKFCLAFCAYLGNPIIQNKHKDIVVDVKSVEGVTLKSENARGPAVKDALPLHNDSCGLLGMYCIRDAKSGGETLLTNVYTLHNEIEKIRPDLLRALYEPYGGDRRGHELEGASRINFYPIFSVKNNELLCDYREIYHIDAHNKYPDLARLSHEQLEAMALFNDLAKRRDVCFKTKLEAGDIIFIYNAKILHGRTSFDNASAMEPRHLLRVWLYNSQLSAVPNYYGYPIP